MTLKVDDEITGVKENFDPIIIMNNLSMIDLHVMVIYGFNLSYNA